MNHALMNRKICSMQIIAWGKIRITVSNVASYDRAYLANKRMFPCCTANKHMRLLNRVYGICL